MSEPIMQFFKYAHLPEHMQGVSRPFAELADNVVKSLPRNPERTVALRKLLEAKDAAVMTWEQKLAAINALADSSLKMRQPGDWYLSVPRCEVGGDGVLKSVYGDGRTPELAVEAAWLNMTQIPAELCLVLRAGGPDRKHVRWNGFMWKEIPR